MEAEDILKKFGELSSKRVGWSALFAVSLVLFTIQSIEKLIKGTSFVGDAIRGGVHVQNGRTEVSLWLILLMSGLILAVAVLGVMLGHAAALQRAEAQRSAEAIRAGKDEATRAAESQRKARRCLNDTMYAASVIRARQMPNSIETIKTYDAIRVTYRVGKDFTTTVIREYRIRAVTDPLNFWELGIQPTSSADPVEYLSDIGFKVLDVTDPNNQEPVIYLQTENDLRSKRVCIYFLPQLLKSSPARTIQVSYEWPKHFEQLRRVGREELSFRFNSAESTASVRVEVYIQDGSGGRLDLDVISTYTHTIKPLKESGWSGHVYEAKALPAGRHVHDLSATWVSA